MTSRRAPALALGLAALIAAQLALSLPQPPASAQETDWSVPRMIFEGPGRVDWPFLTADQYGQLHAFWTFAPDASTNRQLFYSRLDLPNVQPMDILTANVNGTGIQAARLASGLAVTWNGTHYGLSTLSPQPDAHDWVLGGSLPPAYANVGFAGAPDGSGWLLYGSRDTNAVFVQQLDGQTGTWEAATLVASTVRVNTAPDWLRLAIAPDGVMHAVWVEYLLPDGWPPQGIFYARSTNGGQDWSLPVEVAGPGNNQPNVVAGPDGQVFLGWVGMSGVGGKYFNESLDGGETWAEPTALRESTGGGGSQGMPLIALDSAGFVHVVVADTPCLWYYTRQSGEWSTAECISRPPGDAGLKELPTMTLSHGNQLHVLWWSDRQQLWYTTRTLEAPRVAPLTIPPTPVPSPTVPAPTRTVAPTTTPLPDFGPLGGSELTTQSGQLAIAAGIAPVALLFLALLAQRLRRK